MKECNQWIQGYKGSMIDRYFPHCNHTCNLVPCKDNSDNEKNKNKNKNRNKRQRRTPNEDKNKNKKNKKIKKNKRNEEI